MQSSEIIQPLALGTAIANSGDKNIPSQTATGTDTSSIAKGFLPITSQPLDDGGQAPERTDFNGMFYLATDQRVFLQNGGVITYDSNVATAIGGYPQGAILAYIDNSGSYGFVKSLVDNNQCNFITTPSYIDGVNWARVPLYNAANLALSNILSTASSNFDGQWVYKMGPYIISTSTGTYSVDLTSYLEVPSDSNVQYEILFNHVYYSNKSGFRNGNVYSDVIRRVTLQTEISSGNMQTSDSGRTTGYIGTIPVKTKLYIGLDNNFAINNFQVIGYRRLGTNQ